jgi:Fe-S oxidoreductase
VHHTQLIDHLFKEGKLKSEQSPVDTITYHDSCYLGRWNGEFDAPRSVIEAVGVPGIKEMVRTKRHGFCCGAGGARMFMEEHEGKRVNFERSDEIIAANVSAVAVACPFCNIMITDGTKELDAEDKLQVLDLAELVANTLPNVHPGIATEPPPQGPSPLGPVGADE